MITQEQLHGNWNQLKGCIQEKWGQLTEDDFAVARGNVDRLVGKIQEKTGESKSKVESFLQSAVESGSTGFSEAADRIRGYASNLTGAGQEQYEQASETLAAGIESATDAVRRRPAESVAVCFGAGLIAGAVMGLILRNNGRS